MSQPPVTAAASAAALAQLRNELRMLSPKKRLDMIIERKDALKVVRALPALDVYATVREVGLDDCLELLELCSPKQVQAFLDLDGWRGDRVDTAAMSTWLRALFAANPDRATGQLRGLDIELLTLLLKLHTRVYDLSAEEEPDADVGLHSITPDQRYLVAYGGTGDDDAMPLVLKEAIDRLMGRDMLFVLRLCEAVRWELPSSLEEASLRWREGRMADVGFLPRHEALEVLAYLDPDATLPAATPAPRAEAADAESVNTDLSTSVVLPWDLLSDGQRALTQALVALPDHAKARVAHELMMCANRVHIAEGGDAGDPASITATARQVADTVGTALAYRAHGDPQKMPTVLAATAVLALFRVGHSLVVKLQRELKKLVDAKDGGLDKEGLLRLDSPLREVAAGLLRARPLLYAGLVDARRTDFRGPSSLAELASAAKAVSEIGFRGALFSARAFGAPVSGGAQTGAPAASSPTGAEPTHGALLGTLLAHALLEDGRALEPLGSADLSRLRERIADDGARTRAVDTIVARAKSFAPLPGALTPDDVERRTRVYASHVLDAVRAELTDVKDASPDARYVSALVSVT